MLLKAVDQSIVSMAEKIRERFQPLKVILFGSRAAGTADEGSDIDFLIVMETPLPPYRQASLIRQFLDETFGVSRSIDIIVRTPAVIERRLKEGDFFLKAVTEKGIVL